MKDESKTFKAIVMEWVTLAGLVIGCFLFLNNQISNLDAKIDRQCGRTDKLFEIYTDTQKEIKNLYIELLKEKKG